MFKETEHPSLSKVQSDAQEEMLLNFEIQQRIKLEHDFELPVGNGSSICVDGYSNTESTVCEVSARVGAPRGSQPSKIMEDALKMLFLEQHQKRPLRKVLIFADKDAMKLFQGNNWMAACLLSFDIEILLADIKPETRTAILDAQERQRGGIARNTSSMI